MQKENEITLRRGGAVVVFDVQGDGTSKSAPFFDAAYGQVDPREIRRIVLKFTENAYFNSEGIKVLVGLFSKAKTNDQQIAITGLSERFINFPLVGYRQICLNLRYQERGIR